MQSYWNGVSRSVCFLVCLEIGQKLFFENYHTYGAHIFLVQMLNWAFFESVTLFNKSDSHTPTHVQHNLRSLSLILKIAIFVNTQVLPSTGVTWNTRVTLNANFWKPYTCFTATKLRVGSDKDMI